MPKTLIILNPHAGNGRAGRAWTRLEPLLWETLGELVVAVTEKPDDVAPHLERAYASGLTRVISIGGDGTNHVLINALAQLNTRHPNDPPMVYGNLPFGTGRDWARGIGTPLDDLQAAARWIASAQPRPTDVGLLEYDNRREYFLNIASAGIGNEIATQVNAARVRRPWTFLQATIRGLLRYHPRPMQITLDGEPWYEGSAYIVAIANGSTFASGMKIAPHAQIRDGLFDVVLVRGANVGSLLAALPRVYRGTHLTHPAVRYGRAREVRVIGEGSPVGVELDGEVAMGRDLTFRVQPGLLHLLS